MPSLPREMLAAQVTEFNKPYTLNHIPLPAPGPHDLLLKTAVASLCHTDFMVRAGQMGTQLPCTASHEGAGTVAAVGSAVTNFQPGDRVMAGILFHACGTCADCLGPEESTQYCAHAGGYVGVTTHGHFAEYACVDARTAARLPDGMAFSTAAPLACAGVTVYRGVVSSGVVAGEWLCVLGAGGGLGHLGVQFAKARGMRVIGIEARDGGLEVAGQCGADVVVDARKGVEEVARRVKEVTGGEGVKCTINVSGADEAVGMACAVTRMHGEVIQIAQPDTVSLPFQELIFRDIRIRGSLISSPGQAAEMLALVAEHGVRVYKSVVRGLENVGELVEMAERGEVRGKGVLIIDEGQVRVEEKEGS